MIFVVVVKGALSILVLLFYCDAKTRKENISLHYADNTYANVHFQYNKIIKKKPEMNVTKSLAIGFGSSGFKDALRCFLGKTIPGCWNNYNVQKIYQQISKINDTLRFLNTQHIYTYIMIK